MFEPQPHSDAVTPPSHDISVEMTGVRFAWLPGATDTLAIDHFVIKKGERLFLTGPSGSGKSTLLSLLGGMSLPRVGHITLLQTEITSLGARQLDRFRADHVGFIFQLFNLVPYFSALDNVLLPCHFSRRRRIRTGSDNFSLRAEAKRLLVALELDNLSLEGRRANELSIGQQQRVAAARAFIGGPEILLVDEPTSALDETAREHFLRLLFAECEHQGTTLIFVSHDSRLGTLFDRTLTLTNLNAIP